MNPQGCGRHISLRADTYGWVGTALFVVGVALSTSCISVSHFGDGWNRGVVDRALLGEWVHVPFDDTQTAAAGYSIGTVFRIIQRGKDLEMTQVDAAGKNGPSNYPVRAFRIGTYQFLGVGPDQGSLMRYTVTGQVLMFCDDLGGEMVDFVASRFPHASSIRRNRDEGVHLVVERLDREAFEILSAIPDTSTFWECEAKWVRRSSGRP